MNIKKSILTVSNMITRDNIFVYSAQASFYIIISSIPFVMMLLSLARYILPVSESDILIMITPFIPEIITSTVESIIHELFYKIDFSIISITALSSFWTASRGIQAIERGTRRVYNAPKRTKIVFDILASFFYTITFIVILLMLLAAFVFGNSILTFLELKSGFWHMFLNKTSSFKWIFTFCILILIFTFIYAAFSGRKVNVKYHIKGAIFTSFSWLLFSLLYSFYIENFAMYSYIYGSLAAIVLLMLWIYFCMIIFLLGGEINDHELQKKLKGYNTTVN